MRKALSARHLGQVLRQYRHHPHHGRRPLSQEFAGEWVGVTQVQISRIESGPPMAHLDRLIHWAELLGIPGRYLWFALPDAPLEPDPPRAGPIRPTRPVDLIDLRGSGVDRSPDGLDSPFEIIQRMQWLGASAMDEVTLGQLERHIPEVIARYEIVGPAHFAPDLVSQRRWLHAVMREHHPPRRLTRLYAAASQMSGILASVALDLRSFATARAYAVEAFHLAHLLADPDLTAWVRATQSLIEYYDGCYAESWAHARDGLRISPRGPQSIRLAANGEARALARMGDRQGVDFAIGRALELLYTLPAAVDTSASLTLGPYCAARVAGNAATAYLILGEPHQVLHHGAQALRVFDEIGMQGPRALTRFDLATSLVQGDTADPDRAADLALEALSIEGAVGFASVIQRAEEFIAAASGLNAVPAIRDVSARVRELTARSPLPELEGPST